MTKIKWQPQFSDKDIVVESTVKKYEGHFKLYNLLIKFKKFNGEWSRTVLRERINRENASAVLLYDIKQDTVVLVEQLRVGCVQDLASDYPSSSPWLLELVAGLVCTGDNPEETAIREAQEEAGVALQALIPVCEYYNTPGAFTEKTWIYCGLIDSEGVGGVFGLEKEDENIKVHVLPFESIFSQLLNNQLLTSASTVIALQWLKLNREILKNKLNE